MKANDIYSQPGYLFRRMHQLATAAFGEVMPDVALTPVQFAALLTIRDNPGMDATRLATAICFDRSTIGHVIGRLEKKGFIIRTEGSLDKRTKQLRITGRGSALLAEVAPRVGEVADVLLAPLEPHDRKELLRLLCLLDRGATGGAGGGQRDAEQAPEGASTAEAGSR